MSVFAIHPGSHNDFTEHVRRYKSTDVGSASTSKVPHYLIKTIPNNDNLTHTYLKDVIGDQFQ